LPCFSASSSFIIFTNFLQIWQIITFVYLAIEPNHIWLFCS
jgi:hypothetical protein